MLCDDSTATDWMPSSGLLDGQDQELSSGSIIGIAGPLIIRPMHSMTSKNKLKTSISSYKGVVAGSSK